MNMCTCGLHVFSVPTRNSLISLIIHWTKTSQLFSFLILHLLFLSFLHMFPLCPYPSALSFSFLLALLLLDRSLLSDCRSPQTAASDRAPRAINSTNPLITFAASCLWSPPRSFEHFIPSSRSTRLRSHKGLLKVVSELMRHMRAVLDKRTSSDKPTGDRDFGGTQVTFGFSELVWQLQPDVARGWCILTNFAVFSS